MRKLLFILLLWAVPAKAQFVINPFNVQPAATNNGFYRLLTIDHTKVLENGTYAVLIDGTYSYLATTANGGKVEDASGYDIVFYTDATLATKLDFEIEYWDATTGRIVAWVERALNTSTDVDIALAYGNAGITTDQSDVTGTWDANYMLVHHYKDGTTLSVVDATGAHNGTNNGATAIAGIIDGAANFNGTSHYISASAPFNIQSNTALTLSAWIKTDETVNLMTILADWNITVSAGWEFTISEFNVGKIGLLFTNSGGTSYFGRRGSTNVTDNTARYVVATFDGSGANTGINLYVNGAVETHTNLTFGAANPGTLANTDFQVGARQLSSNPNQYFEDIIDEVRVSDVVRSANHIATIYNIESSPSTFYSVGSENTAP